MNLALLKTGRKIRGIRRRKLPICAEGNRDLLYPCDLYGAAGMGSIVTTKDVHLVPIKLQEAFFHTTVFETKNSTELCRFDIVCTIPVMQQASICFMDNGGPFYKFKYGTFEPECLYGVSSYFTSNVDTPSDSCNNGSYFVRVGLFTDWIDFWIYGPPNYS